jgi:hypothetical protein
VITPEAFLAFAAYAELLAGDLAKLNDDASTWDVIEASRKAAQLKSLADDMWDFVLALPPQKETT